MGRQSFPAQQTASTSERFFSHMQRAHNVVTSGIFGFPRLDDVAPQPSDMFVLVRALEADWSYRLGCTGITKTSANSSCQSIQCQGSVAGYSSRKIHIQGLK